MSIFRSFTYLPLWVAVALLSFCIEAPAQNPPPSPLSSCTFLSPRSRWLSNNHPLPNLTLLTDDYGRNLNLFKQTSFPLHTDLSIVASFTASYNISTEEDRTSQGGGFKLPSLAFILARSTDAIVVSDVQSMELSSSGCDPSLPIDCFIPKPFHACNTFPPHDLHIQASVALSIHTDHDDDEAFLKDEVSFTYLADFAELSAEVVTYRNGWELKQRFIFNTTSDASNSTISTEESTTFFVGYITSGKPSINVTMISTQPSINVTIISTPPLAIDDKTNSYKHIKVLLWVLVGTFSVGTLIGLITLVLSPKKHHGRRRGPLVSSHPYGHGLSPLERRPPFSHHDLESRAMPMMSSPPLPPLHSDSFHLSTTIATTSWLKEPSPR